MNILLVVREFSATGNGGISYHTTHLSQALHEQGHNIYVLCSETASTTEHEPFVRRLYTVNPREYLPVQPSFALAAKGQVESIVHQKEVDFVQYHSPGWWDPIKEVVQIYKAHMCFSANFDIIGKLYLGQSLRLLPKSLLYNLYGRTVATNLERASLSSADGVIFNSILTENQFQNKFDTVIDKKTIPNGIDPNIFLPQPSESDEIYFLHVGGSRIKGVDMVLEAWERYDGPVDQLKIAGTISEKSDRLRAQQANNVDTVGKVSQKELSLLYSGAVALIHPARYEPFGNVVFEAAACGTPSVTSKKTVGAVDFLPNEYYLPIDEISAESLVAKLEQIYPNENKIEMSQCEDFRQNHNWKGVAKDTIEFVSNIE